MMANTISEEEVRQTVVKVRHPEIDRTLFELEMIKDIAIGDNKVILTMVFPFLGIPIRDYLVHSVQETVTKLGVEIEVKLAEMNQEERDAFLATAQEDWIG